MKVMVFGASGLIGDGIVQESLQAADVTEVVTVGRSPLTVRHPKLRHLAHSDFLDLNAISPELADTDACFWALGTSAAGVSPQDYERVTYDYTTAAAHAFATINPTATFVYLSGAGTDSTEQGRSRWARVKGRTENAVIATLPNGYALRPGFVQPSHDMRSKTTLYRWATTALAPIAPLLLRALPAYATSTRQIGRAALHLARHGHPERVLESRDIAAAGQRR